MVLFTKQQKMNNTESPWKKRQILPLKSHGKLETFSTAKYSMQKNMILIRTMLCYL